MAFVSDLTRVLRAHPWDRKWGLLFSPLFCVTGMGPGSSHLLGTHSKPKPCHCSFSFKTIPLCK